jgi:hypothetical protein
MDHCLRLVAHKVVAKQGPLFPLPWAGADSTTVSGNQSINMDNPINVGLKDADYESYFGCARCFVWAIVIEVGLLIGGWLCWCLLFTPR